VSILFAGPRMRRDDHRQRVRLGQAVEHVAEPGELVGKVNVLLAVGTDDEVFSLLQPERPSTSLCPIFGR